MSIMVDLKADQWLAVTLWQAGPRLGLNFMVERKPWKLLDTGLIGSVSF